MADNPVVSDKTVTHTPGEKVDPSAFSDYRLNGPTAQTEKTPPTSAPKESGDLSVTPIQTLLPKTEAPTTPGTAKDVANSNKDASEKSVEGRTDINQGQENILNSAKDAVGKELWRGTKHEGIVNGGKLGAAASVSEVLKQSGVTDADSASISTLEQKLKDSGFVSKGLTDAQPGDVVVYQPNESNPSKRIGIVGEPNAEGKPTIYQMDTQGRWRHHEMRVQNNSNTKVYTPGCGE